MLPEGTLRFAVYCLFEWFVDNPNNTDKIIPLTETEAYYPKVKEKLDIGVNNYYRSYSRIKEYFDNYKGNFSDLLADFSLIYDKSQKSFIILQSEETRKNARLYQNCYNTNNTHNTENTQDIKKDNNTNNTNNTKNKESVLNVLCVVKTPEAFDKKNRINIF